MEMRKQLELSAAKIETTRAKAQLTGSGNEDAAG